MSDSEALFASPSWLGVGPDDKRSRVILDVLDVSGALGACVLSVARHVFEPSYGIAWAKAFAFTELIEAPIYRRWVPTGWPNALAASAITHPFVWFVFPVIGAAFDLGWAITSLLSELFAIVVEASFFRWRSAIRWRRAWLVSFVANAASVMLGLLVRSTLGIV